MNALAVRVAGAIGNLQIDVGGDVAGNSDDGHVVAAGAPLVIVGPNGAGKTSLLLMILGAIRPVTGRISLGESVLLDTTRRIDVAVEDRHIGYLPQDYALFPHLTVAQNLAFALGCRAGPARRDRRERDARVAALLAELEIEHLAQRRPHALSGGERQRAALARALAGEPRALLLDEPLAALDIGARRQVRAFVARTLARLGLPAIVVTHDPVDAVALGQRIAVLEAGRVVQIGTFAELCAAPASPFVAELVASAPSAPSEPGSID